jgi:aminoglycoside phosphotransferase
MMFGLETQLRRLVPELFVGGPVSTVLIRTTYPKIMVFGADATRPLCVAQAGPREHLSAVHDVLARLHAAMPDRVPEPLRLEPLSEDRALSVVRGVPGWPWFRLRMAYRSAAAWRAIVRASVDALVDFRTAVAAEPAWIRSTAPGDELRAELERCLSGGVGLSQRVVAHVRALADALDRQGTRSAQAQHGDFCLANLLVDGEAARVIDFDEFGETCMPLQDEVGLLLSLRQLAPAAALPVVRDPDLFHQLLGRDADLAGGAPWHLHYLLRRTNRCIGQPSRARAQRALIADIEQASQPGFRLVDAPASALRE